MVEINNRTTVEVDLNWLEKIVKTVLKGEGRQEAENLSLAFIGPGRMRKLNKIYRQKNRITDVLSFPETAVPFLKFKIGSLQKVNGLGEIVICLREVKKNAQRQKISFEEELLKVLVHGLLHLLEYDHEKSAEKAKQMQEKEKAYFLELQSNKL